MFAQRHLSRAPSEGDLLAGVAVIRLCSNVVLCIAAVVIFHSGGSQANFLMRMFADICVKLEWSFYGITSTPLLFIVSVSRFMSPQLFRGYFLHTYKPICISVVKTPMEKDYYLLNLSKQKLTIYPKATWVIVSWKLFLCKIRELKFLWVIFTPNKQKGTT